MSPKPEIKEDNGVLTLKASYRETPEIFLVQIGDKYYIWDDWHKVIERECWTDPFGNLDMLMKFE